MSYFSDFFEPIDLDYIPISVCHTHADLCIVDHRLWCQGFSATVLTRMAMVRSIAGNNCNSGFMWRNEDIVGLDRANSLFIDSFFA